MQIIESSATAIFAAAVTVTADSPQQAADRAYTAYNRAAAAIGKVACGDRSEMKQTGDHTYTVNFF